jgi:hypothetical protein
MLMIRQTALQHPFPHVAGHIEDAVQVDLDHRFPLRKLHLLEGLVAGNAGAIDQDVDRAVLLGDLCDHARAVLERGDVGGDGVDGETLGLADPSSTLPRRPPRRGDDSR